MYLLTILIAKTQPDGLMRKLTSLSVLGIQGHYGVISESMLRLLYVVPIRVSFSACVLN
jgi:hypothetical protein